MTTPSIAQPLELLATDAEIAEWPVGPCSICSRRILAGHRFARVVKSGRRAHVSCISMAAGTDSRRAA